MDQTMECRSCARGLDHRADVRYKGASERLHGFTVVAPCAPGSGRADGCRPPVSQQFDGLQAVPDTQAYVQRHVRFHVGADLSQRVLRTGDDMHAQGTPQRGDAHQPVHIVGQLVVQRMELVDDDDQRGWRGLQLPDRADTLRGDQMLPASQLQLQRPQRANGVIQIEVAHAAHGMRQPLDDAERRTSLEIQEHEMQPVGRIAHRHGQAPALQQHGFAGARGAGDQGVRPLAGQIDRERPLP